MTLKFFPGTTREIYTRRVRLPKYNGEQSIFTLSTVDAGKVLFRRLTNWTRAEHHEAGVFYRSESERLKKAWTKAANRAALSTFKRPFEFHDYRISGIGRDEFSERDKKILRTLAHDSGLASIAATAHDAAAKYAGRINAAINNPAKSTVRTGPAITIQVKKARGWHDVRTAHFKTKRSLEKYLRMVARMYGKTARAVLRSRGSKKKPVTNPADRAAEIKAAASLQTRFSGHPPKILKKLTLPKPPRIVARIGTLRAVIYDTVRGGARETYIHRFKRKARPTFATSSDGRQLYLIGGSYNFTDRGIVDKDDDGS